MKTKRKFCTNERLRTYGKSFIVLTCLAGFLYQTTEFFLLYLTYPTVVDIQVTSPSYVDMPSFTFCNPLGLKFDKFCSYFEKRTQACIAKMLNGMTGLCTVVPHFCVNKEPPPGFQIVAINKFSQEVAFEPEDRDFIIMELSDFLECVIEFAGETKPCNLTSIVGPYYSEHDMPSFCYSIYSHWGNPNKKREQIQKGSIMKLHFNLNATFRAEDDPRPGTPAYIIPSSPSVQIGIHSPYFIPSPYLYGSGFLGGQASEIVLKQEEKHLLPAPYQTNCTDFMTGWKARGGKAPINQMTFLQECKMNASYAKYQCIPTSVDYPHNFSVCRKCGSYTPPNVSATLCDRTLMDHCAKLSEQFNQPCDFTSYDVTIKRKLITVQRVLSHPFMPDPEMISEQLIEHPCDGFNVWSKECSIIDVNIIFEGFEINNLTYFPKYVSLELFSVIGGYMGMWLGVSLIAVYDFAEVVSRQIFQNVKKKRREKKLRAIKKKNGHHWASSIHRSDRDPANLRKHIELPDYY